MRCIIALDNVPNNSNDFRSLLELIALSIDPATVEPGTFVISDPLKASAYGTCTFETSYPVPVAPRERHLCVVPDTVGALPAQEAAAEGAAAS